MTYPLSTRRSRPRVCRRERRTTDKWSTVSGEMFCTWCRDGSSWYYAPCTHSNSQDCQCNHFHFSLYPLSKIIIEKMLGNYIGVIIMTLYISYIFSYSKNVRQKNMSETLGHTWM